MKQLYTLLLLSGISVSAFAQMPNANFENWHANEPDGWATNNIQATGAVTKSSNAHAGSSAVQLNVISTGPGPYNTLGGKIATGDSITNYIGFTDSIMPGTLSGWYMMSSVGGDFLVVSGSVMSRDTLVAFGILPHLDTATVYKEFTMTFDNHGNINCDTASISFQIQNTNGTPVHVGSIALVDDLTLTSFVGVEEIKNTAALEPCSPNPATNVANIIYSIASHSNVSVDLYDVTGQKVRSILNNASQTEGRYKIPTDVSDLANGMYFYRLTVDGKTLTQKLVVAK